MRAPRAPWLALLVAAAASGAEPPAKPAPKPKALTKEGIADVIHEHREELRRCQEQAVSAAVSGKVRVGFTIELDGKVSQVRVVQSTVASPKLEGCVEKVVKGLRFPPPKHGKVSVTFPFQLGEAAARDGGSSSPARPFVPPPPDPSDE